MPLQAGFEKTLKNAKATVAGWGYTDILGEDEMYPFDYNRRPGDGIFNFEIIITCIIMWLKLLADFIYRYCLHCNAAINPADQLQKVTLRVMPLRQCRRAHRNTGTPIYNNRNLCAGGETGTIKLLVKVIWHKLKLL